MSPSRHDFGFELLRLWISISEYINVDACRSKVGARSEQDRRTILNSHASSQNSNG